MAPSIQPLPYTASSISLLWIDVLLVLRLTLLWPLEEGLFTLRPWTFLIKGLVTIVWPIIPYGSGDLDELHWSLWNWGNAWAILFHVVAGVAQVIFLFIWLPSGLTGFPLPIFLLTPVFIGSAAGFVALNMVFCYTFLDGLPGATFYDGQKFSKNPGSEAPTERLVSNTEEHEGERWVFINGVAVGSHWMQSNLDRIAKTFKRPVMGIHNPTYGILGDILECIAQRIFTYATLDIRRAYEKISSLLADDNTKKLVLIAHSQGSIEASTVLDWLYATAPTKHIEKLEVFTFGNASNHWNCPKNSSGETIIKHIEHYANEDDWVSRFGILHFRRLSPASPTPGNASASSGQPGPEGTNGYLQLLDGQRISNAVSRSSTFKRESAMTGKDRFVGRLFKRSGSGHQFNQHYLNNLFPMDKALTAVVDDEKTGFMNQVADLSVLDEHDIVVPQERVAGMKVKAYSRLWKYRNGKTPGRAISSSQ